MTLKQVVGDGRAEGEKGDIESEDEVDQLVDDTMGDEGSDEEDGSDKDDGSDEEDGSGEDEANPDHQSSDEDNHEKGNHTTPTTPLAASGYKRSRTGSADNIHISKCIPGSVKSDKKDDPDTFPRKRSKHSSPSSPFVPLPVNPPEEHIRNAERIDHLNTSTRLCTQSIHILHTTALSYQMQRTAVETQLDALFATMNAIESNSTDALTPTQIDQFKTSKREFLDVLLEYRPIDFRAIRIQAILDKITAKLHQ